MILMCKWEFNNKESANLFKITLKMVEFTN